MSFGLVVLVLGLSGLTAQPAGDASEGRAASARVERGVVDEGLRILIVPPRNAPLERVEELYEGLRAAGLAPVGLEERAGVDRILELDERAAPSVDTARALLVAARTHLRALELEETNANLDAALAEVLRLERPHEARDLLIDVLLLRASLALARNEGDDALADLRLTARLDPNRDALHPGLFAPAVVESFAKARVLNNAAGRGLLVLRPRVAHHGTAVVFIDGRPFAERRLDGEGSLGAGPHLVTIGAAGARSSSRIVDLVLEPTVLEPFIAPAGTDAQRSALVERARKQGFDVATASALMELTAAGALLDVDAQPPTLYVPGRARVMLALPNLDGRTLGRATLAALQAPLRGDADVVDLEPPPLWITLAITGASVVVVGVAVGLGAWALLPARPVPPPPRPVVATCCVP